LGWDVPFGVPSTDLACLEKVYPHRQGAWPAHLTDEHDRSRGNLSHGGSGWQPGDAYLIEISHHLKQDFGIHHATL
jgi:hypothetical protein